MSRRSIAKHDSALSDDDDDAPGAAVTSRMHELQSDSDDEGREGEIEIDEDDVDRDPPTAAASSSNASSLQELPSYKALMSSLGGKAASPGSAGSSSLSPGAAAVPAASSSASSAAADADENHGYLADDPAAAAGDSDGDEDADDLSPKAVGPGGVRHTFESMYARAERLEKKGFLRKAASYYLYCLEQYRYSHQHQDLIASCLRRLGDICYRNRKYKEALQFRAAERMVYEANLMRVVKTDAAKEQALAAAAAAAAAEQAGAATTSAAASSNSASSSSSASARSSRTPLVASAGPASQIMSLQSSDPTPLPRTALTPASLLAEEERALTFERLAKVFFDEKNLDMARSYATKAIALRRRIKEKWGDPANMDKDQLLLHQLAVMGQEQYESTLRRFKGQPDSTPALAAAEIGLDSEPAASEAATAKLQYDMAQSLQALASGRLNSVAAIGGGKAVGSAPRSKVTAAPVDEGDDSKEESEETMRQRRARAAATAATVAAGGKKKVAFDQTSAAAAAGSVSDSAGQQVASVVNESSGLVLSSAAKRRALLLSLGVGFLILVLAIAVLSYQFKDVLFPLVPRPVQHTRPPNAADRLRH